MGKVGHNHTIVRAAAIVAFVGLCLFIGTAHTAVPGEADLFEKAYGFYQSGEYGKASELFETFLKEYSGSSVRDSVLYWQAKSLIRLGKLDNARALLNTLIEQYPQSTFNGFARQELEVMKQTASSGPEPPPAGAEIQKTTQREPDACTENLRKADDRFRSLKDQLADSFARNQFLENELTSTTKDKQYLRNVIEELKQAREGLPKSAAEVGILKAENERLQQELRTLSSRPTSAEMPAAPGKSLVEKQLLDDVLRKNSSLEQKNREVLEKSLAYIRQTDERIQKLEAERDLAQGRLREAEKRQTELQSGQAELARVRTEAEARVKKSADEKNLLEKKLREQETTMAEMRSLKEEFERLKTEHQSGKTVMAEADRDLQKLRDERDELRKRVKNADVKDLEIAALGVRLKEAEKKLAEAVQAGSSSKDLDAYARLRDESSQLAPAVKKAELRIRQLEDEKTVLQQKVKEAEQRRADAGEKLLRTERQTAEAAGQIKKLTEATAGCDKKIQQYEAVIAGLAKSKDEHEVLRAENLKLAAALKGNEESIARLQKEKDDLGRQIKGFAETNKTLDELGSKLQAAEHKQAETEKKYTELTKKQQDTEKRLAETEQKRLETEVQAKKALADRVQTEGQLKEKESAVALLKKVQGEKEGLLAQSKLAQEELQKLRDEKAGLQKRQAESERLRAETAEQIRKLTDEKAGFEKRIREHETVLADVAKTKGSVEGLKAENQRLALAIKGNEEQIKNLQKEKDDLGRQITAAGDAHKTVTELSAKLREAEGLFSGSEKKYAELQKKQLETEKRQADLEARLRETESKKADVEAQAKKLREEAGRTEALVKERDGLVQVIERLRQESGRLTEDARSRSALLQQATEELRKIRLENEQLQNQLAENKDRERGSDTVQHKLKLAEQQKAELEVQLRKVMDERAFHEKSLREKDAVIFRLEKALADNQRVRHDGAETVKKLDESNRLLSILNDEYKNLMRRYEDLSRQQGQMKSGPGAAAARVSPYDAPALKLGGRQYTRFQIIEESLISERVLSAMKIGSVPWRRGNPYEDFISEQVLFEKAGEAFLRAKQADIDALAKRYRFDGREREYLVKYMTIEEFVGRKIREQAVDEARIRTYYEDNKQLYATKKSEKMVTALILPYTSGAQLEGAIRMTEIQAEASGGKPLDMLYQGGADGLLLRQSRYRDLPVWIQEKLHDLKVGEPSSIISTDDQYMIYQVWHTEGGFRKYEEVKEGIRNSLAAAEVLGPWLSRIRKEAEEIK